MKLHEVKLLSCLSFRIFYFDNRYFVIVDWRFIVAVSRIVSELFHFQRNILFFFFRNKLSYLHFVFLKKSLRNEHRLFRWYENKQNKIVFHSKLTTLLLSCCVLFVCLLFAQMKGGEELAEFEQVPSGKQILFYFSNILFFSFFFFRFKGDWQNAALYIRKMPNAGFRIQIHMFMFLNRNNICNIHSFINISIQFSYGSARAVVATINRYARFNSGHNFLFGCC